MYKLDSKKTQSQNSQGWESLCETIQKKRQRSQNKKAQHEKALTRFVTSEPASLFAIGVRLIDRINRFKKTIGATVHYGRDRTCGVRFGCNTRN